MNGRREILGSIVLAAVGAAYLLIAARYPLETLANPGPGIFPLVVGAMVVGLAAWQTVHGVRALRHTPGGMPAPGGRAGGEGPAGAAEDGWKAAVMVALLVVYLLVVGRIGFLVCTAGVVLACSKLMNAPGWRRPLLLAAGVILFCYVVFEVWLKVPFPKGVLR